MSDVQVNPQDSASNSDDEEEDEEAKVCICIQCNFKCRYSKNYFYPLCLSCRN